MSLFFVKDNFNLFLKRLLEKVNKNGFIVANFLGKEAFYEKCGFIKIPFDYTGYGMTRTIEKV